MAANDSSSVDASIELMHHIASKGHSRIPEVHVGEYPVINEEQLEFIYDGSICIKVVMPFWYYKAILIWADDAETALTAYKEIQ